MYKWEDNANKHIDAGTDIPDEILKQTLKEIYDKYLTDKPRKMGKLECMTVNYPPTFNPNNEKIIEIEEKGSSITVKVMCFTLEWKHKDFINSKTGRFLEI